MRADAQVLKGHLDTLLLASLENGPRHGYAVKEALRPAGGPVPRGVVSELSDPGQGKPASRIGG